MAVIGVRLSTCVTSSVLLSHVSHSQIVTQHVADSDRANRETVTSERRGYWYVIVQPVDGSAEWRCAHYDQLAAFVHRPYLVHWLRY